MFYRVCGHWKGQGQPQKLGHGSSNRVYVNSRTARGRNNREWFLVRNNLPFVVQELCESRGGRPGLSVLTSLLVSVDVKLYSTMLRHGLSLSLICQLTSEDIKQHYLPTYLPFIVSICLSSSGLFLFSFVRLSSALVSVSHLKKESIYSWRTRLCWSRNFLFRAQELCGSRGGRPGLPVPNSPYSPNRRRRRSFLALSDTPSPAVETG